MLLSELIHSLQQALAQHGDVPVMTVHDNWQNAVLPGTPDVFGIGYYDQQHNYYPTVHSYLNSFGECDSKEQAVVQHQDLQGPFFCIGGEDVS